MRLLPLLLPLLILPFTNQAQTPPVRQFTTVANKKMCYISAGIANRKPGQPVIVLEAGAGGAGTLIFNNIFPEIAKIAATFSYDRNGEGKSDLDTTLTTDADIIKRLHALLQTLNITPPYVFVGHSLGGSYIRLYTAIYPQEVKGLVFLDPAPGSMTDEQLAIIKHIAPERWELGKTNLEKTLADTLLPPLQRYRLKHMLNTVFKDGYFKEYAALPPLPDIPVAVLLAYNYPSPAHKDTTERQKMIAKANDTLNEFRIQNYQRMVEYNHNSFVMLLPGFKHFIYKQDPDLIVEVIKRIYKQNTYIHTKN